MLCRQRHVIALIVYIILNQSTSCLRVAKESTHSKQKCYKNITNSVAQQESPTTQSPKCITLSHPLCLGLKLPYNSVLIPDHLPDLNFKTFDELDAYLDRWSGAKKLPKCWPNIQVALCSLLMPQCYEDSMTGRASRYLKPSVDICNDFVNRVECRYIERQLQEWPALFNCNDTNIYARNCSNELRELKYASVTSQSICQYPLVPTNDDTTWFRDIGGCSMHCKFPISTPNDLANISLLIKMLSLTGLVSTLFALIMYRSKTDDSSRMTKVMKRCTMCQLIFYSGWSLQIIQNSDVACSPNGSSLYGLPLVANSCVLSFILTYMPSLSTRIWCAHFGKLYLEKLTSKDEKPPGTSETERTLSLFIYGISLALFVSVAFLGHIDGNGLYGVCTVGQQSMLIKTIFIFVPNILATVYGTVFFLNIIKQALLEDPKMVQITRPNFVRISALAAVTIIQAIFEPLNYFYERKNESRWIDSIEKYIGCQMNLVSVDPTASLLDLTNTRECNIDAKPIVTFYYIEIITTLSLGLVIASWTFQESYYSCLRNKLIEFLETKDGRRQRKRLDNYEGEPLCRLINGGPNGSQMKHNDDGSILDWTDRSMPNYKREIAHSEPSIDTRSSLGSITISFPNSSTTHGNIGYDIGKGKHNKQPRGPTSRDIVNDCRQRINNQDSATSNAMALDQQQKLCAAIQIMQSLGFNPPDWQNLPPGQQPHFNHGACSYDYGADDLDKDKSEA